MKIIRKLENEKKYDIFIRMSRVIYHYGRLLQAQAC